MKNTTAPHYLLLTQAKSNSDPQNRGGVWRFVLEQIGSTERIEVAEEEPGYWGERLQLLAVVRGLEAIEESARVTLITPSRFVGNGIRRGLTTWRNNGWKWERFGNLAPIKHKDLWMRVDQALQYHQINCRVWDFDEPGFSSNTVRPAGRNRISFSEIESARKLSFADASADRDSMLNNAPQVEGLSSHPLTFKRVTEMPAQQRSDEMPIGERRVENESGDKAPVSRSSVGSAFDRQESTGQQINVTVKPIGSGRAFGYVPN